MSENLSLKKIRVLVLEDNPAEAEINIRELRRAGFDAEWRCVETESDFLAALSSPPDLILSDYSMPQFDGMKAVKLLRERGLDTPFILISGTLGEEIAVQSIKEGADDFLLKDRLTRLGPAVASALETKRLRDERRQAEVRIHYLNRVYAVLSDINKNIVREKNPDKMMAEACRIAVEKGLFRMAWIGMLDVSSQIVRPVASAGVVDGYLETINIDLKDDALRQGPTGQALLSGEHQICTDIETDSFLLPWREDALRRGYRSSACFPLKLDGQTGGTFTLYAGEPFSFNEAEIQLLDELALDIGFALEVNRREEDRQRAEKAMLASEVRYRRLFEAAKDGILILNAESGEIVDVNPFLMNLLGQEHAYFLGKQLWEIGCFKDIIANQDAFRKLQREKYIRYDNLPLKTKEGCSIWVEFVSNVYDVSGKNVIQCNIRDITERKHAAEQLENFANRLSIATAVAKIGVWDWNLSTNELVWDAQIRDIYRFPNELNTVTYDDWAERVHPDDILETAELLRQTVENKGRGHRFFRIVLPDGSIRDIEAMESVILDDAQRAVRVVGVNMDITERKRATDERDRLFNHSLDLLCVASFDNRLEQVNPAWTASLGWSAKELTSRPRMEFVHPQDLAATMAAAAQIMQGVPRRDFENRYICKDGSYRWLSWNCYPLMASRQIFCVARDVTEARQRDAQLHLLETCISRLNDIVLITEAEPIDEPGPRILYVNDAFVRRTGFSREEALGKTPRIMQGEKTQREVLDRIRASLKAWKPIREELINYTKSGEEFWLELDIVPVADATGWFTHWIAIERDITERKRVELKIGEHLLELTRWQNVMLNREDRVQKLKTEVNQLLARHGQPIRYSSQDNL